MNDLKSKLLSLNVCVDNEYLDKYVDLIESNHDREREKFKTQRHHIIPKYYYKSVNEAVDNSKDNLVNLLYSEHIVAHSYLMMCSFNHKFAINNCCAIHRLLSTIGKEFSFNIFDKSVQEEYEKLVRLNPMSVDEYKKIHDNKMKSESVRTAISTTLKNKISLGEINKDELASRFPGTAGCVRIHKNGIYKTVSKEILCQYLSEGWILGGKPLSDEHKEALLKSLIGREVSEESRKKMSDSHLGKRPANYGIPRSEDTKKKISETLTGSRWMTNGDITTQVIKGKIDEYLNNGFRFGRK